MPRRKPTVYPVTKAAHHYGYTQPFHLSTVATLIEVCQKWKLATDDRKPALVDRLHLFFSKKKIPENSKCIHWLKCKCAYENIFLEKSEVTAPRNALSDKPTLKNVIDFINQEENIIKSNTVGLLVEEEVSGKTLMKWIRKQDNRLHDTFGIKIGKMEEALDVLEETEEIELSKLVFKYVNLRYLLRKFEKKWEPKSKKMLNDIYVRNIHNQYDVDDIELSYEEIRWINLNKGKMEQYIYELEKKYEYNSFFDHRNNTIKTFNKNKWQSQRIRKQKIYSKYKHTNIYVPNMQKYQRNKANYAAKVKPNLKKKRRYSIKKQSLKNDCFAYWLQYKHIPRSDEYEYWINLEQCKDLKFEMKRLLKIHYSTRYSIKRIASFHIKSKFWKQIKWITKYGYDNLLNAIKDSDYPRNYMKKYVIQRLSLNKPLIRKIMEEIKYEYQFAFAEIDRYHSNYSKKNFSHYLLNVINMKGITNDICSIILDFVSSDCTMIWCDDLRQYEKANCFQETYIPFEYGEEGKFTREWLDGNDNDFPTKFQLEPIEHPDTIHIFYDGMLRWPVLYLRIGFMTFKGEYVYFYNEMSERAGRHTVDTKMVFSKKWLNLYNWIKKEKCDYWGRNEYWILEMYSFLFE